MWFLKRFSTFSFCARSYDHMPECLTVRGWRRLNRPMVCTVGAVAPGAGFSHFKMRVSQVHFTRVQFVDAETTRVKGKTSRRPNFFVFRPIEVPKEPRQGFLDALKPLEQSEQSYTEGKPSQNPFFRREAFEEETLSDHFWELWTSVLHAVFFAWFLRSGRT
jgi:hypothetical protein